MLTERDNLILKEVKGNGSKSILLDIEDNYYDELKEEARKKDISIEDYFLLKMIEEIMKRKKKEASDLHSDKKIIDIFDMYRIEEIIEELENEDNVAMVVDLKSDKYPIIIPIEKYNRMIGNLKNLKVGE